MRTFAEYVGKPFVFGKNDCFTLVRAFYKQEFGIDITPYATYDGWWNDGRNFYADNLPKEGFYLLDREEPQFGDLYLMCLNSPAPGHCAIWVGDNKILHHVQDRLSRVDQFRGIFRNFTVSRWRHESLRNMKKEQIEYEIIKRAKETNIVDL